MKLKLKKGNENTIKKRRWNYNVRKNKRRTNSIFSSRSCKDITFKPNYIYELVKKGKLKAVKLKSIKILKSTLEDFLKENEGNDLSDIDNIRKISICEDIER